MCCETESTPAEVFGESSDCTSRGFSFAVELCFCNLGLPCITVRLDIIDSNHGPATSAKLEEAEAANKLHTITAQFSPKLRQIYEQGTGNGLVSNLDCYHGDMVFTDEMQEMQEMQRIASGSKDNEEVLTRLRWDTNGASLSRFSGGLKLTDGQFERLRAHPYSDMLGPYLDLFEKSLTCPGTIMMVFTHKKTPKWTEEDLTKMVKIFEGKDIEESQMRASSQRTKRLQEYWTVVGVQLMLTVAVTFLCFTLYSCFGGMGGGSFYTVDQVVRSPATRTSTHPAPKSAVFNITMAATVQWI